MAAHPPSADAKGHDGKGHGGKHAPSPSGKILGLPRRLAFLGGGLTVGIFLLAGVFWWLFPGESTESKFLVEAVALLEAGEFDKAAELITPLAEAQFHDPKFPGGMAYAQGVLGYHEARNSEKEMELPRLAAAIAFLRDAQAREPAIVKRPTWQQAMAQCLYRTGGIEEARKWLVPLSVTPGPYRAASIDTLCALDLSLIDINRITPPPITEPVAQPATTSEEHAPDTHAKEGHDKAGHGDSQHSDSHDDSHGKSSHGGGHGGGHGSGHGAEPAEPEEPVEPPFVDPFGTLPLLEGDLRRLADLLGDSTLPPADQTMLLLRKADVLLALERTGEAEAALQLARLSATDADGLAIQEARLAMAKRKFDEAEKLLRPLTEGKRPNAQHVRTALYLLARCALEKSNAEKTLNEQLALRGEAMKRLRDLQVRFVGTEEAVVGMLDMADVHRLEGNTERAIELYSGAVRTIVRLEDYHNRWLSQTAFRDRIRSAWQAWLDGGKYAEALTLAESLPPLFDRVETAEMVANTTQAWAQAQQEEYDGLPESLKPQRSATVRTRWKASAKAWFQLAQARKMTFRYPDDLWASSTNSIQARDYATALSRVDEYLATLPRDMLATALVRKAGLLMDLDRLDEAIPILESIREKFPEDPSCYKAQARLAIAFTEKNDLGQAEAQWRSILTADNLTPEAAEWKEALLRLGSLLVDRGVLLRQDSNRPGKNATPALPVATNASVTTQSPFPAETAGTPLPEAGFDGIRAVQIEASSRLTEFLARYPEDPSRVQAMYQLSRSQREQARLIRRLLETPQTEAVKLRLIEQQHTLDEQSLDNLVALRSVLTKQSNLDALDPLGEAMLATTAFDVAHQLFELRRDKEAIAAYNTAINRYRDSVQVLPAFLQMAEAYRRLGKPAEARSMLEQGRVILRQKQIPDSAFDSLGSSLTRAEWELWLEKISQLGS